MVIALDKMVGDLVEHLRKENLLNNTMIIFTSDNGAALYSRTVTNEPLTGGKFTFYEGGINVPLIFYYPGKIQPSTVLTEPVMLFDIYATIADLAELPHVEDRIIDGRSLIRQLFSGRQYSMHDQLFWYSEYNMPMRMGNCKLHLNTLDKTIELNDLSKGNTENAEISGEHPTIVKMMQLYLEEWVGELPSALWPRLVDYQLMVNGKLTRWGV